MNTKVMNGNTPGVVPVGEQPTQVPMAEVQAIIGELMTQRNMMADRCANLAIQVRVLQQQLDELRAQTSIANSVAPAAGDRHPA